MALDVGGQGAMHVLRRVVESQHFFDCGCHTFGLSREQRLLGRMAGEEFDGVSDHLGRGFVPGDDEQHAEAQ